jgi:heme/copper-type cytochrome/quinol oxidase subunit 4
LVVTNRSSSGDCIFDFFAKTALTKGKRRILKWFHILVLALIAVEILLLAFWRIKDTTDSRISSRTNLFGLKLALVTVKNLLNVKKSGEQITTFLKKYFLSY